MPFFSCESPRSTSTVQQMYYAKPACHPDRVLPEHDLIYLLEGQWEIWEEETMYLLTPGDVLLLSAGRRHFGTGGCKPGTRTLFAHITASPDDLFSGDSAHTGVELPSMIHCRNAPGVIRTFWQLLDSFWSDTPHRQVQVSALLELLFCELAHAASSDHNPLHQLAVKAQSLLHLDPQGHLTTEKLAKKLGVTARRLRYAFEQEAGLPIHRYHLNVRLDMAMNLMQSEQERTLRDFAQAYGFCDEFHFSRAFKKRFGISPGQIMKAD